MFCMCYITVHGDVLLPEFIAASLSLARILVIVVKLENRKQYTNKQLLFKVDGPVWSQRP